MSCGSGRGGPSAAQPGPGLESTGVTGSAGRTLLCPLRDGGGHTGDNLLNSHSSGEGNRAGTRTPPAPEPGAADCASGPDGDPAAPAILSRSCCLHHGDINASLAS